MYIAKACLDYGSYGMFTLVDVIAQVQWISLFQQKTRSFAYAVRKVFFVV